MTKLYFKIMKYLQIFEILFTKKGSIYKIKGNFIYVYLTLFLYSYFTKN